MLVRSLLPVAGICLFATLLSTGCGDGANGGATSPTITMHPADQTVTEGETVTFAVTATGSGALAYQWLRDGAEIADATSASYTTPATTPTDDGAQFACVVRDQIGNVTSNPGTLTVVPLLPMVTTHPSSQAVREGQTATFLVTAIGAGTLAYQWYEDGVEVGGATGDRYTTPAATLANDGAQFTCVVSNVNGNVESNPATLTVTVFAFKIVDLMIGTITACDSVPDLLTNDDYKTTKLVLKRIAAGNFQMGDQTGDGQLDELPVHTVNITQGFYIGVFEVTQRQWYEIEGDWPSLFTTTPDKRPVEQVSWDRCQGFLVQLSSEAGETFRLPTEAEWEYACRAGTSTDFSYGDAEDGAYMWYDPNSGNESHEVGTREPNPWGLYDMHGNIYEWCHDWYGSGYYAVSPPDDPQGPTTGDLRVLRGGSWYVIDGICRSALRGWSPPDGWYCNKGFRVILVPEL